MLRDIVEMFYNLWLAVVKPNKKQSGFIIYRQQDNKSDNNCCIQKAGGLPLNDDHYDMAFH